MQHASLEPLPLEPAPSGGQQTAARQDPRLAQMAALLPAHLELRRIIGEGGSSVVFEAFHARLKVLVAVKVLSVRGELAAQAYTRMMREAELYALLDDPRIPRVYDVNELSNGTPYVVMEMVPGQSLEELLRQHHVLPVPLALTIAREVLSALASVHERGVLHRDVKPANVILNFAEDGASQVRLVDFGIAKMADYDSGQEAVTQRGTLVGTPQYMPPERLTGQSADASSDTYAVGIMLYEMLSGQVPFGGPNLGAVMASVLRDVAPPLSSRSREVSPELSHLVMCAISRDPRQRFAAARDMLTALAQLRQDTNEVSGARAAGELLRELTLSEEDFADELRAAQRGKHRYGAIVLTFVGLLLVGAVGWFYAEYKHNTAANAAREPHGPGAAQELAEAPATGSAAPRELAPAAPTERSQLALPQNEPAPAPATTAAQEREPAADREAPRADRRRRASQRIRREARTEQREAREQPKAEPAIVAPTAPDYAKLLPSNPY